MPRVTKAELKERIRVLEIEAHGFRSAVSRAKSDLRREQEEHDRLRKTYEFLEKSHGESVSGWGTTSRERNDARLALAKLAASQSQLSWYDWARSWWGMDYADGLRKEARGEPMSPESPDEDHRVE